MASLGWYLADCPPSVAKLEDSLSDLKALFKANQGLRFNDVVNVLKDARKQLDREGGPVDLRRAT